MPSFDAVTGIVHLLPALVWGVLAYQSWRLRRDFQLPMTSLRIAPFLAGVTSLHFLLHTVVAFTPTELEGTAAGLHGVLESLIAVAIVTAIVLFRHLVPTLAVPEEPRRSGWLALNYGSALVVSLIAFLPVVVGPRPALDRWLTPHLLPIAYTLGMVVLALRHASRLARRGVWRAGLAVGELRSPDVVVVGAALLATGAMLLMSVLWGAAAPASAAGLFVHTAMGLAIAVPFVVRMFGRVVRSVLLSVAMIGGTAAVWLGARALAARAAGPELAALVDLGAIAALLAVAVPGRAWLEAAIERTLLRRRPDRLAELQAFLHALAPELGAAECCRRALAEACRVLHLRGAAILLSDGATVAHGEFDPGPIERAWPRLPPAGALRDHAFSEADLRELPPALREALVESAVVWVVPIASPRRHWGHLFATEALLTMASSSEDSRDIAAFVGQLALVLDTTELLARALAVERSLAHAEKLAAIGETAARIAHEIRNPVTAARSLAQQMSRDPTAPVNAEHAALILAELERVERQVAALLRFARRDELSFAPVDLGELVRTTLDGFASRLDAARVGLELHAPGGVIARADGEKLRQVLVNLVENAIDALDGVERRRRLTIALEGVNGTARLRVTDTGPGVSAEALPRLFEPFFSLKAHGTGLGLAIAKRTIDAHGGRIAASCAPGGGMSVQVELPLGGPPP